MGTFQGGCGSGGVDVPGIHHGAQEAQYISCVLSTLTVCSTPPCASRLGDPSPGSPSPGDRSLQGQPSLYALLHTLPKSDSSSGFLCVQAALGFPSLPTPHLPCASVLSHTVNFSHRPPFLPIVFHPSLSQRCPSRSQNSVVERTGSWRPACLSPATFWQVRTFP